MEDEKATKKLYQRLSLRPRPTALKEMSTLLGIPEVETQQACLELADRGLVTLSGDTVMPVSW
jgi:hypothetical protein